MLDSNVSNPDNEQWKWLLERLGNVPEGVQYLFIVQHHPAMTHSSGRLPGGGHSLRPVDQRLASLLEESRKRLNLPDVVLAGHVHNYERYVHGGVIYITAGGGGATPHEIPRDPADLYQAPGSTYSYCRVTVDRNSLSFQMIKVQIANQQPSFTVEDSFQLGQGHAKPAAASPKAKSSRARSPMHSWPSSRELYARPFSNQTQVALSQKAICDRLQLSEIPRNYLTQSAGG